MLTVLYFLIIKSHLLSRKLISLGVSVVTVWRWPQRSVDLYETRTGERLTIVYPEVQPGTWSSHFVTASSSGGTTFLERRKNSVASALLWSF